MLAASSGPRNVTPWDTDFGLFADPTCAFGGSWDRRRGISKSKWPSTLPSPSAHFLNLTCMLGSSEPSTSKFSLTWSVWCITTETLRAFAKMTWSLPSVWWPFASLSFNWDSSSFVAKSLGKWSKHWLSKTAIRLLPGVPKMAQPVLGQLQKANADTNISRYYMYLKKVNICIEIMGKSGLYIFI